MSQAASIEALAPADLAPPSFTDLYHAHCDYVWCSLRRLGVPERDLEDGVHDLFLVVHKKLGEYDPARPIRPWLFGIAMRIASDYRKRARNRHEIISDQVPETDRDAPGPAEALESKQARDALLNALSQIDLKHRAVLIMHDLNGHTVAEISEALAISTNTLYSRLRTGRDKLERALRRHTLAGASV